MIWTRYEQCLAWLEEAGMATILPGKGPLPDLFRQSGARNWDEAGERIWVWKDDLAQNAQAWSGRLFDARVVLVHRRLLPAFFRWRSLSRDPQEVRERYQDGLLGQDAWRLYQALAGSSQAVGRKRLRALLALVGKANTSRFEKACLELERMLVLTRAGRVSEGGGWDSCSYALSTHHFADPLAEAQALSWKAARSAVEAALRRAAPTLNERTLKRWLQ